MITVNLESLKLGMVLAKPIKNRFGQIMLGENVKIEEKHLNMFKMWGLDEFVVFDEKDSKLISEDKDEIRELANNQVLNDIFNWGVLNELENEYIEFIIDLKASFIKKEKKNE